MVRDNFILVSDRLIIFLISADTVYMCIYIKNKILNKAFSLQILNIYIYKISTLSFLLYS